MDLRLSKGHAARKQDIVTCQRILHERGWAAPHRPQAYGGAGLGTVERLTLVEELQRATRHSPCHPNEVFFDNARVPIEKPDRRQA